MVPSTPMLFGRCVIACLILTVLIYKYSIDIEILFDKFPEIVKNFKHLHSC
jgi:hypothetical protein